MGARMFHDVVTGLEFNRKCTVYMGLGVKSIFFISVTDPWTHIESIDFGI